MSFGHEPTCRSVTRGDLCNCYGLNQGERIAALEARNRALVEALRQAVWSVRRDKDDTTGDDKARLLKTIQVLLANESAKEKP